MWNEDTRNTPQRYLLFSTMNLSNYITVSSWWKKNTWNSGDSLRCQNICLNLAYSKSSDHGVKLLLSKNIFNIKVSVWSGLNNGYQDFRLMITGCRTEFLHCDPTICVAESRYLMRCAIWYCLYNLSVFY